MALFGKKETAAQAPLLEVRDLSVHYGRAHAVQGVSFTLGEGVFGLVGRNGMGKSSLCNAITGLVPATGSVKLAGEEILGRRPNEITRRGIAYVPQGRRMWPSLTVDETLRLVARQRSGIERVYAMFPRLAERKGNGGAQLSGGEQQMLAIGRALLLEPRVLVMDEPTEGLAPVIVEQVAQALRELAAQTHIGILLIEQNLGVALDVADRIGVMVNGRIAHEMPSRELAADRGLQERLLGVRSSADDDAEVPDDLPQSVQPARVVTVRRAHAEADAAPMPAAPRSLRAINQWNAGAAHSRIGDKVLGPSGQDAGPQEHERGDRGHEDAPVHAPTAEIVPLPVAAGARRAAFVAGTFDTKGRELMYVKQCLEKRGIRVVTVDLATSGKPSSASVHPREVARHHPQGEAAVFTGDRGSAVTAMAIAFERYLLSRADVGGVLGAGGSGGTALVTQAMRALPIGLPKVMVSTMASGDTRPYVGPSDICMMYPVTDVSGINRISERVLANAANALAGMMAHPAHGQDSAAKPALGLSMFGVTTPCVQAVTRLLSEDYDCLVFHATGVGGQSMEKLAGSQLLAGVIDVSTTEIADEIAGGTLSAGPGRLDVFARHALPYVGSCGALDMANFGAWDTVPERFRGRRLYRHNPNVTLMRTTPDECRAIGEFIARKLNAMQGPVRFLIPEGGVSAIDRPGQPFHDPDADRALFAAIEANFRAGPGRKLQKFAHHINDEAFALALVAAWREVTAARTTPRAATA